MKYDICLRVRHPELCHKHFVDVDSPLAMLLVEEHPSGGVYIEARENGLVAALFVDSDDIVTLRDTLSKIIIRKKA